MSKENLRRSCIDCAVTACENNGAKYPPFCTQNQIDEDFLKETMKLYTEDEQNAEVTKKSALVEYENYCT